MMKTVMIGLVAGTALSLGACSDKEPAAPSGDVNQAIAAAAGPADPIEGALAAAPAAIAKDAAVVAINPDGSMKQLREGGNGWTCMPDNPETPGTDPMCMDGNAMKWAQAWIGHKPPPADNVGLMYMLAGGSDASNTDPYGKTPKKGGKWVDTGPHVMVVGSEALNRQYPSGDENPDTSKPYVMFAGTPYAHMMIPVK